MGWEKEQGAFVDFSLNFNSVERLCVMRENGKMHYFFWVNKKAAITSVSLE